MKRYHVALVFLVGIAVGIILWNIIGLSLEQPVYAQAVGESDGESAGGLIAITGLISTSISGLWIVDTREGDHTPSLCFYIPDGTRGVKLIGARRIKYDFGLVQYNDRTDNDLKPNLVKKKIEELEKKAKEEEDKKNK